MKDPADKPEETSVPTYDELVERVKTLEGQISILIGSTRSLMETCTQLVRGYTDNRKTIEDILSFLTPSDDLVDAEEDQMTAQSEMTPEQLAAQKKMLN